MIALHGIRKSFATPDGAVDVLAGIDLQVRRAEVVALLGPSGCGKSTLLRIAAGLEAPDRGQVLFNEAHNSRGFMFQEPRLLPWLTVEANVLFPVVGEASAETRDRARGLIDLVGLDGFERAFPHQLSGGMAQRVALARTLLLAPTVLLMDEPFGALDGMTKMRLQGELRQLKDFSRAATIFVTHDIEEAVFLADRVVVLSARPASLRVAIDIDLPAARDRNDRLFNDFRRAVHEACFGAGTQTQPTQSAARSISHVAK